MRQIAFLLVLAQTPTAPATAARVAAATPATAHAALLHPLSMIKTADLDYGVIFVSGVGTAVIDPVSDAMAVTGGVANGGGVLSDQTHRSLS